MIGQLARKVPYVHSHGQLRCIKSRSHYKRIKRVSHALKKKSFITKTPPNQRLCSLMLEAAISDTIDPKRETAWVFAIHLMYVSVTISLRRP